MTDARLYLTPLNTVTVFCDDLNEWQDVIDITDYRQECLKQTNTDELRFNLSQITARADLNPALL